MVQFVRLHRCCLTLLNSLDPLIDPLINVYEYIEPIKAGKQTRPDHGLEMLNGDEGNLWIADIIGYPGVGKNA